MEVKCLWCLAVDPPDNRSNSDRSDLRKKLKTFSEYLKYYFIQNVDESVVVLCEKCENLLEKFTELLVTLEMVKMKIDACLKQIVDTMEEGNQSELETEPDFQKLRSLREDLISNGALKLRQSKFQPTVKLERLSTKVFPIMDIEDVKLEVREEYNHYEEPVPVLDVDLNWNTDTILHQHENEETSSYLYDTDLTGLDVDASRSERAKKFPYSITKRRKPFQRYIERNNCEPQEIDPGLEPVDHVIDIQSDTESHFQLDADPVETSPVHTEKADDFIVKKTLVGEDGNPRLHTFCLRCNTRVEETKLSHWRKFHKDSAKPPRRRRGQQLPHFIVKKDKGIKYGRRLQLYHCTICDEELPSTNLHRHKMRHGIGLYQCHVCSRTSTSRQLLSKHIKKSHYCNRQSKRNTERTHFPSPSLTTITTNSGDYVLVKPEPGENEIDSPIEPEIQPESDPLEIKPVQMEKADTFIVRKAVDIGNGLKKEYVYCLMCDKRIEEGRSEHWRRFHKDSAKPVQRYEQALPDFIVKKGTVVKYGNILQVYQCTLCDLELPSANLHSHKKKHGIGLFTCTICLRKYRDRVMYLKHVERRNCYRPTDLKAEGAHASENADDFMVKQAYDNGSGVVKQYTFCLRCNVRVEESRLNHWKKFHKGTAKPPKRKLNQPLPDFIVKKGRVFRYGQKLQLYHCTLCDKELPSVNLHRHKMKHGIGIFTCHACSKTFTRRHLLRNHVENGKCRGVPSVERHDTAVPAADPLEVVTSVSAPIEKADDFIVKRTMDIGNGTMKMCTYCIRCDSQVDGGRFLHWKKFHKDTERPKRRIENPLPEFIVKKGTIYKYGSKLQLYQCTICDLELPSLNLHRHKLKHGVGVFRCHICSKTFKRKHVYMQHLESKECNPDDNFTMVSKNYVDEQAFDLDLDLGLE